MKRSTPDQQKTCTQQDPKKIRHEASTAKCICCNPLCDETMRKLEQVDKDRVAYFNVPSLPGELLKKNYPKAQLLQQEIKQKKRERFLKALGLDAKAKADDENYSNTTRMKFTSIHLHKDIYALCITTSRASCNVKRLPESIPRKIGLRLNNNGLAFREADEVPESKDFFPLPNYHLKQAMADVEMMLQKIELETPVDHLIPNTHRRTTRSGDSIKCNPVNQRDRLIESLQIKLKEQEEMINKQKEHIRNQTIECKDLKGKLTA